MMAYTTQLQAALGMIEETRILLALWDEGMTATELTHASLESGAFPNMTARRVRNLVTEGFKPRYLCRGDSPAKLLKKLLSRLTNREFSQLLFLYTCRAHEILMDFVSDFYWKAYGSGRETISNRQAREFVQAAISDGRTSSTWSESTVTRVAAYLTGCLADFSLLESGRLSTRQFIPFRIELRVSAILAHDLHFAGYGDNQIVGHADWRLFGLERDDVLEELKRLSLRDLLIVQSGGGVVRINWKHQKMEELIDVLANG